MRIHLDNVNLLAPTGPNTFAYRLSKALIEQGHDVVFADGKGADVSLVFIQPTEDAKLAKRVVQRLDGLWSKPSEFHVKNKSIRTLYDVTDAVVWQSDFDRKMTVKWWGDKKRGEVIHNGIDLTPVKELTLPTLVAMRQTYERMFVCSSNWHPQKRLNANVALFKRLQEKHPSSCLIIMGNNPQAMVPSPNIYYTGHIATEIYMQIYAATDYMLHLCYADHCPNVVCESLSQGTPVVCSEVGGTKELIRDITGKDYGIILKEKERYNFELIDYDDPPEIDVTQIEDLPMREQLGEFYPENIDIKQVAKKYVRLFESVLQC